jgi:phosphopantetheine--protein transferase-like protein
LFSGADRSPGQRRSGRWTVLRDARPRGTLDAQRSEVAAMSLVGALAARTQCCRGIGVDVVDIAGFAHNYRLGQQRWLGKLFTDRELDDCAGDLAKLATRFAAKEAVSKALGSGFRGVSPRDVEIITAPTGQPSTRLHAGAAAVAATAGIGSVLISMSREQDAALAAAIALPAAFHSTHQRRL